MRNITLMLLFFKVVILRNVPRAAFDKIPADNWPENRVSHKQPFPSLHFIKTAYTVTQSAVPTVTVWRKKRNIL